MFINEIIMLWKSVNDWLYDYNKSSLTYVKIHLVCFKIKYPNHWHNRENRSIVNIKIRDQNSRDKELDQGWQIISTQVPIPNYIIYLKHFVENELWAATGFSRENAGQQFSAQVGVEGSVCFGVEGVVTVWTLCPQYC